MNKPTADQLYKLATECKDPAPTQTPELWRKWACSGAIARSFMAAMGMEPARFEGPLRVIRYSPRYFD